MSGGGGGSKTSPVEKAVSQQLRDNLFPGAQDFFGTGTEGIFTGSRLADESQATSDAREQALSLADLLGTQSQSLLSGFQPLLDTNVGDVESTFLDTVNAEGARQSALTQDLIDQVGIQAGQQFERNILPAIGDSATAAGQFGSSRQGIAEGVAAGDAARSLQGTVAGLLQGDAARQDALRESALNRALGERTGQLDRALSASSLFPTLQQSQLAPLGLLEGVGASQDARAQQELLDQIGVTEGQRNADLRRLQEFQGLLGFTGANQFSPAQSSGDPSRLQGALGGAAAGAQIGSAVPGVGTATGAGIGALAGAFL